MLVTFWVAVCLASSAVVAVSLDKPYYDLDDAENLFKDFIKQHGKVYNGREYLERLEIFKESLKDINFRNEKYPLTVFAVNRFSDLTPDELELYRGIVPLRNVTENKTTMPFHPNIVSNEVPAFDWRKEGIISPVKDQGKCGCGYIFATVANVESRYAMKHRQCLAFSESQALDCCSHNRGCEGGSGMDMLWVLRDYYQQDMGFMMEKDYPYYPEKQACHYNKSEEVTKILPWSILLPVHDEEYLKIFLGAVDEAAAKFKLGKYANLGPLGYCSGLTDTASKKHLFFISGLSAADFKHYSGGILEPDLCTGKPLDHCVLLVGYGEEKGKKFWILKNSWGEDWGEKGYVRLVRGVNACEIGNTLLIIANIP
ncbi:procathepsin L-like [Cydia splendana]|uniref:procathepsin L-like n=1 Tax=Cydia splendana TaxID=1100963 RepID=UPI00300C0C6A